jgi:hypothetical protein
MNADGSGQTLLTPEENYPECPDNAPGYAHRRDSEQPSWSPDGASIAFVSDRIDDPSGPDADIFTVPATGGGIAPLITGLYTEDPDWGPAVSLNAGSCTNVTTGTAAGETLAGTGAGDRLVGLAGDDVLRGLAGTDCLEGGPGADRLEGGPGNDILNGGTGNDRLIGGTGKNRYSAGAGRDVVSARNGTRETVNCGSGRDTATVDRKDRPRGCERVRRG